MFGRESALPIDFVFQGVEREAKLKNKSHEQFLKEWGESIEEACKIAREKMGKMAGYNKKSYDKKAKAVEIVVGDRVLMRNKRDRSEGTGKLTSYWEHSIFVVTEKKENLPVYRIKNIHKKSDVRVVHRNLLMLCNELPMEVFDEETVRKENARKKKSNLSKKSKKPMTEPVENTGDGDGEEYELVIQKTIPVTNRNIAGTEPIPVTVDEGDHEEIAGEQEHADAVEPVLEMVADEPEAAAVADQEIGDVPDVIEVPDEVVQVEDSESGEEESAEAVHLEESDFGESSDNESAESEHHEDEEIQDMNDETLENELTEEGNQEAESSGNDESDENLESESEDDDPENRTPRPTRPTREVRTRNVFSYETVGGDPVFVEVKR